MKYDYKNIKPYLQTQPKKDKRRFIRAIIMVLVFFGTFPLLADLIEQADKIKIVLAIIFCSIAFIMIVWSIYLIMTFDRHEGYFTLYQGVSCVALSLIFLGISIKFNYIARHNKLSISYILFCIIIFSLIIYVLFSNLIKNLKTDYYLKERRINVKAIGAFAGMGGLGIIFSRITRIFLSYDANMMGISIVMLILAFIFELGSHNIYKYYLIGKYKSFNKKTYKV